MIRVSTLLALICVCLLGTTVTPSVANAQAGSRRYKSQPSRGNEHRDQRYRRHQQYPAPAQNYYQNGWYQRPYPYHLDYYRMRYGGSYAPYFGNLYGPPPIYNFGPLSPFYGGAYFW